MDGLKQRIVGALVLVCLAVIFVPMIFDEPHSERQSTPITIPEQPPFPEVDMPEEPAVETQNYGLEEQPAPSPDTRDAAEEASGFRLIEESGSPASEQAESEASAPSEPVEDEPAGDQGAQSEPVKPDAEFSRTLEGAWVVQLGSFGNKDNARNLRDEVVEMGYGAHLQEISGEDTRWTRVFSGPFVDKSDAEAAKRRLDEAFSLDSLVTKGGK